MKLSHLALTVIEDPDHAGRFHWLLLESTGEIDQVRESPASEATFDSAQKAFDAGARRCGRRTKTPIRSATRMPTPSDSHPPATTL
ncbi:hypothetical protein [Variovorax sp. OK605]|uniref:hypothetical protein n=1 Tax=Variovorax sp. OK605 TaxID=1855317 RepID=UPI00116073BF|nr:hypothetical protein [Variovorax sp. OK605]